MGSSKKVVNIEVSQSTALQRERSEKPEKLDIKDVASTRSSTVADAFRRWGYLQASLDTMGRLEPVAIPEIDSLKGAEADRYREIYCKNIGVETAHINIPARTQWVTDRMEQPSERVDQKYLFRRLLEAEMFERFIHTRYVGSKRFSLEGLGAMIPLFDSILEEAADNGFKYALIGMAHRGRLTTLTTVVQCPPRNIFACFEDVDPQSALHSSDVKYHLGATGTYTTRGGKEIRVHLASNPSHLEAVNPVITGRARARQERLKDEKRSKVLVILVHGDAALAGQGITAETLNLADMNGFTVGGTVHIVANNLIGFTAPSTSCYSTKFATDIAKRLPVPIYHVNAEVPEDVYRVGKMAMEFRCKFSTDVFVDLIGYRRFGHNEGDDPTFTMPVLYGKIEKHAYLYQIYAEQIGMKEAEVKQVEEEYIARLTEERDEAQKMTKKPAFFALPEYWDAYVGGSYDYSYEIDTGIARGKLSELAVKLTSVPAGFNVHPKMQKLLEQRQEMGSGTKPIDWGMAEALAFASLLTEGVPVRLSGQDSRRGTFSHRQSYLFDSKTGKEYVPLSNLAAKQASYSAFNSILSEAAVLGFEYGFSRDFPEALVLWEAQFGDFANGAQIIIDQFISAAEDKWSLLSGVVMLLPHGYEGQGPEHSSARLERFLQLAAEDNIQVVYPSTSAQYFHLLRRQALRKWRKPLVVMTPKSMLRNPVANCPLDAFSAGRFQTILNDKDRYQHAERILFCTGKIAHDLRTEREKRGAHDTAIVTIEQLYPFPEEELAELLSLYSHAKNIVWVQEEPANMGALFFVRPYLEQLADRGKVTTVRRSASASPATGSAKAHELEQKTLINLAFADYK